MEFSTKIVEEMAKLMVGELKKRETGDEGILGMENKSRELLRAVGAQAIGEYLSGTEPGQETAKVKCRCGGEARFHSWRKATLLSVFGQVKYERRYFICEQCHQGQSPRDEQMGLAPGKVTAGLARLLGIAGVEHSYEEAARMVEEFLLVSVSDNTVRKETEGFGELQAALEKEEAQASQDETKLQERIRKQGPSQGRLYGSIDGAIIPLREEWREMKCLAWYQVHTIQKHQERRHHARAVGEQNHLQAENISYACEIADPEQFGSLVWSTGWKRKADLQDQVIFVCDGAVWIWRLVEKYFPNAVQIVDWYHASAYLAPVANAAFGDGTIQAKDWLEQARNQLWEGQIDAILADGQRLVALYPAAAPAVHNLTSYYQRNQNRMRYAEFRQHNYFIGSGTIESACKQIAGARLKLAGARWTFDGSVETAKARAAWLSRSWDALALKRASLPLVS